VNLSDDEVLAKRLGVMRIIAFALTAGVAIFVGVDLVLIHMYFNGVGLSPPDGLPYVTIVAIIMLIVNVPLSFIVPESTAGINLRRIADGTWQPVPGTNPDDYRTDLGKLLAVYQSSMIVGLAMLEAAAFTGCIAYLLEANPLALAVAVVAMILMIARFPTETRSRDWLEKKTEALADLPG
jgi:hypothetical protein